jgi:hypothetical protein
MMKRLLATSALLFGSVAFAAGAPNLTGQWSVHSNVSGNESNQECKFVQTGDKLTGSCKSTDKEVQITGSVDGKTVKWKYDSEYDGSPLTVSFMATVDDPEKISGSVDVEPYGVTGDFTATPSKSADK